MKALTYTVHYSERKKVWVINGGLKTFHVNEVRAKCVDIRTVTKQRQRRGPTSAFKMKGFISIKDGVATITKWKEERVAEVIEGYHTMKVMNEELQTYYAEIQYRFTKDKDWIDHGEGGSWVDTSHVETIRVEYKTLSGNDYSPSQEELDHFAEQIDRELRGHWRLG